VTRTVFYGLKEAVAGGSDFVFLFNLFSSGLVSGWGSDYKIKESCW